ncbi:hypothetical protein RR46_04325 [Papilio xuthus]|uniref:Uncharacterized protein n=1 Tax=Papilio xuthus TaxID=66420 RepID=A0A194QDU5_PAPXU|nr:hypothetical protein RR46_04325 [Papilio xuthus]
MRASVVTAVCAVSVAMAARVVRWRAPRGCRPGRWWPGGRAGLSGSVSL